VHQTGPVSDTRISILKAASELLNDDGLEAITIRHVADASNFGRSTVMHHFGDKEGLLDALHLVALGHISAAINNTRFVHFNPQATPVLEAIESLPNEFAPGHEPPLGISLFPRFRREYPGFWTILRFRCCPNFTRDDLPVVWDQINILTNGYIGAPIGPTVDLIVHQLLALHDWIAAAGPDDALRIVQDQPSVPYWISVFDRGYRN
jgi:AcrR family transcriptional regulator